MKKKFLAMLVTVAMLAAMLTPIGAMATTPEVTKTYFDFNFENWDEWGDYKFDGGKQSDNSEVNHQWSGTPHAMRAVEDSERGEKVMKAVIPTSGENDSGYYLRTRMEENKLPGYTSSQVFWHEFSIKYEGGFVGFGPNENSNGYSIITVNKNGQLAIGARFAYAEVGYGSGFEEGTIIPGVQLALNNWYDIKVAADFTDANALSGVPTYVWVNDELVSSGIRIPNIIHGYGWGHAKLYFDIASTEGCVAYIDDIKIYDTATLGEIENPGDGGDSGDGDDTGNTDIPVVPDIDNTAAKTKSYFSIGFENWTTQSDNNFGGGKNSDGTAIDHEWGEAVWQMSPAAVSDRTGQVMKVLVPTSGGGKYLFRSRMKVSGGHPGDYTAVKVLWNEFSIKYETGFAGFGTNENDGGTSIISINKDGKLVLGSQQGYNEVGGSGYVKGIEVPKGQLELGKWYNIAVAADFTDADASILGVPTYVWLNGSLISEGVRIANIKPGSNWKYNKLYFDQAETTACTAYIDDVEVYETAEVGNGVEKEINVMSDGLNSIAASIFTRSGDSHPVEKMVDGSKSGDDLYKSQKIEAEKDGLTVVAALNGVYSISSVTFTEACWKSQDNDLTVTIEIGKNGVLTTVVEAGSVEAGADEGNPWVNKYDFDATEGDTIVYTFKAANHREVQSDYQIYELEAYGKYVEDVDKTGFVPEIGFWFYWSDNSRVNYYISAHNAGDEDIEGKIFIAAYNDDNELVAISLKEETLRTGANILGGSVVYTDKEGNGGLYNPEYTYKAFFWDGTDAATPVLTPVDVIK